MSVARLFLEDGSHEPKRAKLDWSLVMGFSDEDKIETIQLHDDALMIILRIEGYDVKRVMVDQGNAGKIMYLDLFKGLNLRSDALQFSSSKFWREGYYPEGTDQTTDASRFGNSGSRFYRNRCIFSLYSNRCQTLASYFRSGLFHPTSEDQIPIQGKIEEILGDQTMAQQCMIAAIRHKPEVESVTHGEEL